MKIVFPSGPSSAELSSLIASFDEDVLFIGDPRVTIEPGPRMFERLARTMAETGAGWVYSDAVGHPRIDYQAGSVRDTFDFGPVVAVSRRAAREVGLQDGLRWGALYDLRLRLSERFPVVRLPEPLYAATRADTRASGQVMFDYVDPRNRDYQLEMEEIATRHLSRIGVLLPPEFVSVPEPDGDFPVLASVVIPVRNRERTILDAVTSALSQKTSFPFNVLVVDNHSTDRTGDLLRSVADTRLLRLVPEKRDLGIGGCWGLAISSPHCGRYAVQLDSDDLYVDEHVLARIVGELRAGPYAMVVGSYTMVDFSLKEIPPGLIDHREWTRDNGRNNALRVNGFGAPRAFDTAVLRRIGFPNVSYGEDYAVSLRISRDYEIGRIYESVYLCRRWEGNSDSALPLETQNRYDSYKDWLRSVEIAARRARIRGGLVKVSLSGSVEQLFREQLENWPLLRKGVEGLASGQTREVDARGAGVLLRHIPHRVASTTAAVDYESIRKRPCFLCPQNLFPEQKGVPFGDEFTLYCNPYPVVERHLTVVHRDHRVQRIEGQTGTLLDLAAALPGFFVLYNGPQCGASAPDHLHLQAGSLEGLPIVREALACAGPAFERHGARALLLHGSDRGNLVERTERVLSVLSRLTGKEPEPWVNVAVYFDVPGSWTVIVFPREKHRPEAFLRSELLVSPATIDMCGILVTPSARDFEGLTGERVAAIYSEVSLRDEVFREAVSILEAG